MRDKKYDEASSYFQKLLAAKDEQAAESAIGFARLQPFKANPAKLRRSLDKL